MARKNQTEIIAEALAVLRDGGLILYPTDTVWGIGCDATNPAAVAKVFALKRRPDSKSLVLLASDLDMVARYIKVIPPIAVDLVEVNDRPMTLVYPKEVPVFEKYDEFVPEELVRKSFALGVLDVKGMKQRVLSWYRP